MKSRTERSTSPRKRTARSVVPDTLEIDRGTFAILQNAGGSTWQVAGYAWSSDRWHLGHVEVWALISVNGGGMTYARYDPVYPHYIGFSRIDGLNQTEAQFLNWLTQAPQSIHSYVKLRHPVAVLA